MTFEDDLTRELPSALRTFTDLKAYRPTPPSSVAELDDEDIVEDDDGDARAFFAGSTLQLPPITRPLSIPAFSRDVVSPHDASRATALLREPIALVVGAAVLFLCLVTTGLGVAVGRASAAPATSRHVSVAGARAPRTAVVLAAHEAITEAPLTAPMKLAAEVPAPVAPVARPRPQPQPQPVHGPTPPPPPARRPGFQRPSNLPLPPAAHR